jgi:hypothetical protein
MLFISSMPLDPSVPVPDKMIAAASCFDQASDSKKYQ